VKSKQLSIISRRPSPSDFVFFLDRQIDGDDLARVLTDARMKIKRHGERFKHDEDDDEWIDESAQQGWVIVTADKHMETEHIDVICHSRAKVLILTDNNSGYPQWAASLISSHDAIVRHLLSSDGPMIVRLSKVGITKVRHPAEVETRQREAETKRIVRAKKGI
jgi:predicted nuclease of predicted toxin-antitoxin system